MIYQLPPDTGHESDYRAVDTNGLYLKPRPLRHDGLPTLEFTAPTPQPEDDPAHYGTASLPAWETEADPNDERELARAFHLD